jgi:phosphoribosylformylglycinamidine (FGAM) synthase-like enzyme
MAIASGHGVRIRLDTSLPTSALFAERAGRAIVVTDGARRPELEAAFEAARVPAKRIGEAGGESLEIETGGEPMRLALGELEGAWRTAF